MQRSEKTVNFMEREKELYDEYMFNEQETGAFQVVEQIARKIRK